MRAAIKNIRFSLDASIVQIEKVSPEVVYARSLGSTSPSPGTSS